MIPFLLIFSSIANAALPCTPYFADTFRQAAINRINDISKTNGDVVLFVGDSTTQMWSDDVFSGFSVPPVCGSIKNSGLVDWTQIPAVKVNLGLSGIRTCSWLYEYQNYFKSKLAPFAQRVKAVVINLGTNDVIQLATNPSQLPKSEVKFIQQMLDEMILQFPNAKYLIHNISPCLNAACGNAVLRSNRVSEFNFSLYALNGYRGKTVFVQVPLKESDLTMDKIHFNSCGYRKIGQAVRFYLGQWLSNYTYPTSLPLCAVTTPTHPCDL